MKITHWGYDDWEGLFVDGVLFDEGHATPMWLLERASNGKPFTFETKTSDERLGQYLQDHGRFTHKTIAEVEAELNKYGEAQ